MCPHLSLFSDSGENWCPWVRLFSSSVNWKVSIESWAARKGRLRSGNCSPWLSLLVTWSLPAPHGLCPLPAPLRASPHAGRPKGKAAAAAASALVFAAWRAKSSLASEVHCESCQDGSGRVAPPRLRGPGRAAAPGAGLGLMVSSAPGAGMAPSPALGEQEERRIRRLFFLKYVITEALLTSLIGPAKMSIVRAFRDWLCWI